MSKKTVIEYPVGLGRVPYASFIEINKYAYSEAQKTVAKEQNDAFGSLNRSGLADALSFAGGLQEGAYASGDFS